MKSQLLKSAAFASLVVIAASAFSLGSGKGQPIAKVSDVALPGPERDALQSIKEGRQIFRFDTFGDEEFWGDALKLHHAIAGKKLGGVGPGVSPKTALAAPPVCTPCVEFATQPRSPARSRTPIIHAVGP